MAVTVENVTLDADGPIRPRIDVRTVDLTAFWKLVESHAQADVDAHVLQFPADNSREHRIAVKANAKARFLAERTNWPLARRIDQYRYESLSSDGTTVYPIVVDPETCQWRCPCKQPGSCRHLAERTRRDLDLDDPSDRLSFTTVQARVRGMTSHAARGTFSLVDHGCPPGPVHPDDLKLPVQGLRGGKSQILAPEEIGA
jgi:hypothetical protein